MKSRRPGSKGTEWLLIKHRDDDVQPGFDIDKLDYSVLTQRSLAEIAGDQGSAEWASSRKATSRSSRKNAWLADALAKSDEAETRLLRQKLRKAQRRQPRLKKPRSASPQPPRGRQSLAARQRRFGWRRPPPGLRLPITKGAQRAEMPDVIHPMLATLIDEPFDNDRLALRNQVGRLSRHRFHREWLGYASFRAIGTI